MSPDTYWLDSKDTVLSLHIGSRVMLVDKLATSMEEAVHIEAIQRRCEGWQRVIK
jgi:hypothetical protein